GPRDAGPAGGDRSAVPDRGPALAGGRPRRGGPGLQPVPRGFGNPQPADRPGPSGAGQPGARRGHRGGLAGGQGARRRRLPDRGRGEVGRGGWRIAARLGCGVLVSLGGDIAVAGAGPDGGWRVRVQDVTGSPEDRPVGPYALIAIQAGGLAPSSTAARPWPRGGDVLHHILEPRTSPPAEAGWRTASGAADRCAA